MALEEKYKTLLEYAKANDVSDLRVREQNGVLYVDGTAPTESVKDQMWAVYQKLDADMRAGDLVMNIQIGSGQPATASTYTVKAGDSLSKIAQHYPGVSWQEILEANKDQITDPDLIHPGQVLKIPAQ
jgi:nucleoid-associated protein YgaU